MVGDGKVREKGGEGEEVASRQNYFAIKKLAQSFLSDSLERGAFYL